MKVTVTSFGKSPLILAQTCIESIRKHVKCEIVQFTDDKTEPLPWVDDVKRIPYEGDFGAFRLSHFVGMGDEECLHLDNDVIVQRDVSDIFDREFDIALTRRPADDNTVSQKLLRMSPHNNGVIFSRNGEFWRLALKHYKSIPILTWMWSQIAVTEAAHMLRHKFKIIELPGAVYNYTPRSRDEEVSDRAIIHYKGDRKHWMVGREKRDEAREGFELVDAHFKAMDNNVYYTEQHPEACV